ncbi:DUF3431 domain-containing protein [Spirosoma sp. KUDC1026]|uniref:DUF3431 domain-containing protein n=1 Tax=Spirosoma sp. KUDC1026 TaxID=2745947 RepID=UPI00159BAD8C|nr:DUF3431 domain-containing protein [Spirosoma sp. KUDC1026]QKZ11363.1 DUF3431 domain-containing protein [Spirosoma sp. KUDC1026]
MPEVELVVARYTEDLSWLRKRPASLGVTVYDKSPDRSAGDTALVLPNVGREAYTYLHHIVSRYDSLTDWTVFCQGKPFDHAFDFKKTLQALTADPDAFMTGNWFRWLGHLIDTDDNRGERLFQPWSKNEDGRGLDLLGFHKALFGTDGPERYTFVLGAQFIAHRDLIRQQPLSFYERALAVSITFPDAAHCYERSWDRILGVTGIDPDWLAGRQTVYLKPMRHQADTEQNQ